METDGVPEGAKRMVVGHLRPQPDGYGGVVEGLDGSAGADVYAKTLEAAQANLRARAVELGWSPPYRWDGPDAAGVYRLTAIDTRPIP
jgi:hypothetical protein